VRRAHGTEVVPSWLAKLLLLSFGSLLVLGVVILAYAFWVQASPSLAAALSRCRHDSSACSDPAHRYETGTGAPRDLGRAADLYNWACTDGHVPSCERLVTLVCERTIGADLVWADPVRMRALEVSVNRASVCGG